MVTDIKAPRLGGAYLLDNDVRADMKQYLGHNIAFATGFDTQDSVFGRPGNFENINWHYRLLDRLD